MDRKIVLTKTAKGLMEAAGKTTLVGREARNVLTHVDGKATVGDLQAKLKLPERKLDTHLGALMRQGLVREFVMAPASITPPSQMSGLGSHTLDFTALIPRDLNQEAQQQHAEADAIAREIAAATAAREERAGVPAANEPAPGAFVKPPESVDPFAAFRMRADLTLREAEQRVHEEAEKARVELRAKAERESGERGRQEAQAEAQRAEAERRAQEERDKTQEKKQTTERLKQEVRDEARRAIEDQTRRAEEELKRREAEDHARRIAAAHKAREEEEEAAAAAQVQAAMGGETPSLDALPPQSPPMNRGGDTLPRREAETQARKVQEDARRKVREEERAKAKAQAGIAARLRKEERVREVAEAEARAAAKAKERERDTALIASRLQNFRERREVNVGRRVGFALLLTVILAVVALPYIPIDVQPYESLAGARLGHPVSIGRASYMPYPLPHLRLEEVRVGDVQIDEVQARPLWAGLLTDDPAFDELTLRGMRVQPDVLNALLWGRMSGDAPMPARLKLQGLQIEGFGLPALHGVMNVDAAGRRMLDLSDEAGNLSVHLTRQGEEAVFEMHAKTTQGILPLPLVLSDLNVRGIAAARGIQISAFDGRAYDGVIKGSANLTQEGQWLLQGRVEGTQLDVRQFAPALEGRLRGEAQFQLGGEGWRGLGNLMKFTGSFEISKGQINDVDLVRSLREGHFAGGKTPFASLRGQASLEKDNKLALRALQMDAGLLKAGGAAEFSAKGLNGRLNGDMRSSAAGSMRGSFALSGDSRQIKLQPLP